MSLDTPKHCPTCGENIHGFGHRETCPERSSDLCEALPEMAFCGRCRDNASFEWDATEGWVSVCCHWPAIPVDVEPPDDAGMGIWLSEDR